MIQAMPLARRTAPWVDPSHLKRDASERCEERPHQPHRPGVLDDKCRQRGVSLGEHEPHPARHAQTPEHLQRGGGYTARLVKLPSSRKQAGCALAGGNRGPGSSERRAGGGTVVLMAPRIHVNSVLSWRCLPPVRARSHLEHSLEWCGVDVDEGQGDPQPRHARHCNRVLRPPAGVEGRPVPFVCVLDKLVRRQSVKLAGDKKASGLGGRNPGLGLNAAGYFLPQAQLLLASTVLAACQHALPMHRTAHVRLKLFMAALGFSNATRLPEDCGLLLWQRVRRQDCHEGCSSSRASGGYFWGPARGSYLFLQMPARCLPAAACCGWAPGRAAAHPPAAVTVRPAR